MKKSEPKITLPKGVRVTARKPAGSDSFHALIWKDGKMVDAVVPPPDDWWYEREEAIQAGRREVAARLAEGKPLGPPPQRRAPAPRRRAQAGTAEPGEAREVISALRRLEKHWPGEFWLFAASGTLCLMRKVNGRKATVPNGGMDPDQIVATFHGIEVDGGDW